MSKEILVKSKARVRELGEVFTAEREVNAMLDLLPQEVWSSVNKTFLEPACGTGNFLIKILKRKLAIIPAGISTLEKEFQTLCCVASIYGIDICDKNVTTSKQRLKQEVLDFLGTYPEQFISLLDRILDANIQCGNSLQPETLKITEWEVPAEGTFKPKIFQLMDLVQPNPQPIQELNSITYYEI